MAEKVTRSLIRTCLVRKYGSELLWEDVDGDWRLNFKATTKLGRTLCWFKPGPNGDSLRCYAIFEEAVARPDLAAAIFLCNRFSNKYTRPAVYVTFPDGEKESYLQFHAQIDCEQIPFSSMESVSAAAIELFVSGTAIFEEWVVKEPRYWLPR